MGQFFSRLMKKRRMVLSSDVLSGCTVLQQE